MTPVLLSTVCHYFPHNNSLAAKGALTHRLQCCTACKIKNGRQGAPTWPMGVWKGLHLGFLGNPINFRKISFLI